MIQGARDPFGSAEDVKQYELARSIRVEWMPDGDHSFKPRASSGVTLDQNLDRAVEVAAVFIRKH